MQASQGPHRSREQEDVRCGNCNRLLTRAAGVTQLQIKCTRCGVLNHVKAASLEPSPMSAIRPLQRPELKSAQ
ncbi:Com family DNA-binding transcriptional regulator [Pseudomonas monteilii]|uniref:Com family DNA-binding transcriptional regulator n=1 Tax=Pseudomonas alabamensis TaxID=3064349 RepID=UPI000A2F63AF|nr:Com family DNA-binding transcriptional regulator [Pseudomonas entomophila]